MVDRQDIDALLIGSLYGELSSADEARLKAHLESHPADRGVLESLGLAREAVRTSRIFEVQLEPAQSVSARLLQEAARRAPRQADSDGWFARLRRSFLMHPAMATAAMLVVVVGVAGTMYLRKGDHFAAPEVASSEDVSRRLEGSAAAPAAADPVVSSYGMEPSTVPSPAVTAKLESAPIRAKDAPGGGATGTVQDPRDVGSYRVGVADGDAKPSAAKPSDQKKSAELDGNAAFQADAAAADPAPRPEPKAEKAKVPPAAGPSMLEVTTPRRMPKDLEEGERPQQEAKGRAKAEQARPTTPPPPPAPALAPAADAGDELARRGNAQSRPAGRAPEVMPTAPAAATGQSAAGGTPNADDKGFADDPNLAWARDQHSRLVTQVRAGRCTDAAGTAVTLSNRAPGYYQQNVANDRAVKDCLAYINAERERAAEAERARAASRRLTADEAAAPVPSKAAKPAPKPGAKSPDRAEKAAPAKAPAKAQTKSN